MKKIYRLIAILLVAVMLFCSCSTAVETPMPETEQTQTKTPMPASVKDIGQIVYARGTYRSDLENSEVDSYCYPSSPCLPDNGFVRHRVENDVPKVITWNYLGVDFELQYKYSGVYYNFQRFSDDYTDCYVCDGDGYYLWVLFRHGTTTPLCVDYRFNGNYDNFSDSKNPLKHINHTGTEEDYVNLINLNNQEFSKNFTDYDLECTITYHEDYQQVSYKNLDEVKNTGRDIYRVEAFYYPKSFCNVSTDSQVYLRLHSSSWQICYYESDFTEDTKPSKIPEETLWYAYYETEKFARNHFERYNELTGEEIMYERASTPFIPSETRITEFNGRLYLIILLHLIGEWGTHDQGIYEQQHIFYVDYERLQWKMALEGKN